MSYCNSTARVKWPRLYCGTALNSPNRRCLSHLVPSSSRISCTKLRLTNLVLLKQSGRQYMQRHAQQNIERHAKQHFERHPQQHFERHPEQQVERYAQQHVERHIQQNFQRNAQQHVDRHIQRNVQRNAQKHVERHTQRNVQQNAQQHVERHTQRNVQRNAKQHVERHTQRNVQRNAQQHVERHTQRNVQRHGQRNVQRHSQEHNQQQTQQFTQEQTQQQLQNETLPPSMVPTHKDYPLLPKAIFKEPWAIGGWQEVEDVVELDWKPGVVPVEKTSKQKKWKFTLNLKLKNGETFSASRVAQLKKEARKGAAILVLAELHEKGILAAMSKKIQDEKEKEKLNPVNSKSIKHDVYNFGASILAAPDVTVLRTPSGRRATRSSNYTVILKIEELNISIEASGSNFSRVEVEAFSKLMNAIKQYQAENSSDPSQQKPKSGLKISQGKEFVFYYKRKTPDVQTVYIATQNVRNFMDEKGNVMNSSQVLINGARIGAQVFSRKAKDASDLAFLTAAIEIAKNNPDLLRHFFSENRGSSGEIVQRSIQVPLSIEHDTLVDVTRISRPVLMAPETQRPDFNTPSLEEMRLRRPTRQGLTLDEARSRNRTLKLQYDAYQLNPYYKSLRDQKASLPMNQYRDEVLKLVNENHYSIIVGQTGSGKTTQVPAIILEDAIKRGVATSANIVCTQPRRIAAKSVASRVAVERGENLQDTVGYHVYLDAKRPREGCGITFCTTEILLKQLQNSPDEVMSSLSHIIIDEAHERDIPIDFLFITLKKILHARRAIGKPVPKVVIMSATLNIDLFSNYFGRVGPDGTKIPCPSLTVPGKTFPVRKMYLNEILSELDQTYKKRVNLDTCSNTKKFLQIEDAFSNKANLGLNENKPLESSMDKNEVDDSLLPTGLISTTIAHIAKSTSDGAILTFLPGLKDLEDVEKSLLKAPLGVDFSNPSKFQIILLHSLMKDNQSTLFDPSKAGCRKIILATNIAETSITISEVQHVVDTGKLNEMHYDPVTRIKNLKCTWVSKSNSRQRAGRAGRVQNGNYYALFSKIRFESLREYGLPQMLRSDLQDVCLSTKGQALKFPIKDFLADAVEKPSSEAVEVAIKDLVDLGALTEDEQITPLGRLLHSLPVDPDLGKLIVLGVIFRCFDPLLTLASASAERDFFVRPPLRRKEADMARKSFALNSCSDAIALINAIRFARKTRRESTFRDYMSNMIQNFLSAGTFDAIEKRVLQIEQVLIESGLIPRANNRYFNPLQCGHTSLNENSNNVELIKALTLARCPANLAVRIGTTYKLRTKNEASLRIKSGVNALGFGSLSMLPKSAIISYSSIFKDDYQKLYLRDTTLVSPLAAALFGGPLELQNRRLCVDDWVSFTLNTNSTFSLPQKIIVDLRKAMNKMLSQSFLDLAKRRSLLEDPLRRDFTAAIARLLSKSADDPKIEPEESKERYQKVYPGYRTLQPFVSDLLSEIRHS